MRNRYKNCISPLIWLASLLAVVFIVGGCRDGRSDKDDSKTSKDRSATSQAKPAGTSDQQAAAAPIASQPIPDIALEINSQSDLTIYQGTPLIVTVRLANQRASNIISHLASQSEPSLGEQASVVHLSAGWPKLVRFEIRTDSGAEKLIWPLIPIIGQEEQPVALDGQANPETSWGLSPEAAAKVAPGIYRLVAVLEVAGKDSAIWHGKVESELVVLTIQARPENLQGSPATESALDLAYYFAQTGDWAKSLAAAHQATTNDPNSIEGHILIGDALAAGNDHNSALAAYTTALRLYEQKYRNSPMGQTEDEKAKLKEYQPPDYLLRRILLIQKARLSKESVTSPTELPSR
jgi:hypothetical protein